MNNELDDEMELGLTSEELRLLEEDTWNQLKMDPEAAREFLTEAGWVSQRFAVS